MTQEVLSMGNGGGPGAASTFIGEDPIAKDPALAESVHEVMSHLIFHKSIIDEEDSGDRLTGYIDMVRELQEGAHVAMEDPFDKSIAITLELVLTEHLDPWDVNLVEFSRYYLKRVKKEKDIDLITAGRIMLMAWSVLRLQTEEVLTAIEKVRDEANGDFADWFEDVPDWVSYEEPDYQYTSKVIKAEKPVIEERVQRRTPRPVTLLELVDAFEEARRESVLHKDIDSKRKAARERIKRERDVKVQRMMHKESLEEDIVETWSRILTHNGSTIPLEDLHKDGVEDYLTIFVAVLFLALHGRIKLWQKKFPYGEIYLKKLKDGALDDELRAAKASDKKNN
jgi:segregation and condensation protein A